MRFTAVVSIACPKRMEYGPCGGVRASGACEVAEHPCVFLDAPVLAWPETRAADSSQAAHEGEGAGGAGGAAVLGLAQRRLRDRLSAGRVVLADLPAPALDAEALGRNARVVAGAVDAVLLGDSPAERVQLSPSLRAQIVQQQGVDAWSGMTARDRNRVALEGEFASLAVVGAAAVHCVTGDHPASGSRPDALGVFDLDATRMTALAASAGLLVSVAAAPSAPPTDTRAARLLAKLDAGAAICVVDHCGGADAVGRFVREVLDLGRAPAFLACVPVVLDVGSARLLESFPGLRLPDGFLDAVLTASDPFVAGVEATVALAEAMLEIDGVVGVDLSGGPAPGEDERFSEGLARIGSRLRG